MFCPQCGRQLPDDAIHCTNCGRDADQNGQGAPIPPQPDQSQIAHAYQAISNHLALSIIAIFFCLPFGIAGLVQSLKVDQFIKMGDFETAKAFSEKAKTYSMIGLIIGIVLAALSIILSLVFGFGFLNWMGTHYYRY